jgi:hypothetical protein
MEPISLRHKTQTFSPSSFTAAEGATATSNGGSRDSAKESAAGVGGVSGSGSSSAGPNDARGSQAAAMLGAHWDGVLRRQASVEAYITGGESSSIFITPQERDMFAIFGDPVSVTVPIHDKVCFTDSSFPKHQQALGALIDSFSASKDPRVLQRIADGLRDISTLAGFFRARTLL